MKFITPSVKLCSLKEFISYWGQFYNENKYPDNIYKKNLMKEGEIQENNIVPLLEWKNGKRLSKRKKSIASNIIKNLQRFNQFRSKKEIKEEDFKKFWDFISNIVKTGLVWRVFLLHIARPHDYPIVDQHVLRAYYFITHDKMIEPKRSLETYFSYRNFFFKIVKNSSRDCREVDKALMAFGQFLKKYKSLKIF